MENWKQRALQAERNVERAMGLLRHKHARDADARGMEKAISQLNSKVRSMMDVLMWVWMDPKHPEFNARMARNVLGEDVCKNEEYVQNLKELRRIMHNEFPDTYPPVDEP